MQDLISPMAGTAKSNAWREPDRETIMKQWDYWRKQIANGDESSAPRDWFESVLDKLEETTTRWL